MPTNFTSKQPYEAYAISFDFTPVLGAEIISSAVITAVDEDTLDDVSTTILDDTKQSNTNTVVSGWVQNGTADHNYIITCRIVGSMGSRYELDGILPVAEIPSETPPAGTDAAVDPIIAMAMTDIFDSILGSDAVYTPVFGAAISCRVILEKNVLMQPDAMTAQVYDRGITIEAILADVVAEPNRGDTFVIGTETFTVQSIAENDGVTVKMIVT